ncbi:MAG TPA: ATP-binding cassette domain-containing protein [Candidatus Tyrphobacter sp.]
MSDAGSQSAVSTRDLHKAYGSVDAVRALALDVRAGEIFGLIGPDGAGKTSTFQMLAGILPPTSGTATIFGEPARKARMRTGYLTQTFSLYPGLSVAENIRYVGDLRLTPRTDIETRGRRYLEMFGMAAFADRQANQLSGGMKQKLSLVCALVSEPRVLLLDEPTTGVDPVSRREFWDTLVSLSLEGLTILVATPYLDEAERCNTVAFMDRGEIKELGTPDELRASLHARRLVLRTADVSSAQKALAALGKDAAILDVQRYGDHLDVLATDTGAAQHAIETAMQQNGIAVEELRADDPILENVFVASMRAAGDEVASVPFPARRSHRDLRGKAAIGAERLTKRFGSFTAVDDVNFEIRYGEIYGLLGANGAGKTTTIKMLCGLIDPSDGTPSLAQDEDVRSSRVHQQVGYMSQKFSLYDDLPIDENLEFFSSIYGLNKEEAAQKMQWVLAFSSLEERRHQVTGSLPGGWKQRLAFGSAIMHEPPILFLDEPTSGVDPLARRSLWGLIDELADAGAAVLVTTHYLDEAEQCNRVGLMNFGKLIVEGTPSELKARQKGHLLEFRVDQPQKAVGVLRSPEQQWRVALYGNRLHVIVDDAETGKRETERKLAENGIAVRDVREGQFSLEDVFMASVEREGVA